MEKYVKWEDVYICPNGIPVTTAPLPEKKQNSIPRLLFLSNLLESKGVFVLLDALKMLKVGITALLFPLIYLIIKIQSPGPVFWPRPHMLAHTEMYSRLIDQYMVRHFVKPGVTGWAQVTGYRDETKELWQMEGRVKRDIWYMEHWSIWLDLRIVWMTVKTIFIHDKKAY